MSLFRRLAERGGFTAPARPVPVMAPKDRGVGAALSRQAEEEEEVMQPLRRQPEEVEEEEILQTARISRQGEPEEEEVVQPLRRQPEEEEDALQTSRIHRQEEPEEETVQPLRRQAEEEEEELQTARIHRQDEPEEEEVAQPLRRQAEAEEEEPLQAARLRRQPEEEEEPIQAARISRQGQPDDPALEPDRQPPPGLVTDMEEPNPMMADRIADAPAPAGPAPTDAPSAIAAPDIAVPDWPTPMMPFDPRQFPEATGAPMPVAAESRSGDVVIEQVDVLIHEPASPVRAPATDTRRALRARYLGRL